MKSLSQPGSLYWLAFVLLVVDQIAKVATRVYQPHIGWQVFGIGYHANSAATFSITLPPPWPTLLATSFFLVLLMVFLVTKKASPAFISLLFILTAAISNLIDRLAHGAVTDYLVLYNAYLNIADITITIAALLLIKNTLFASSEQAG